MLSFCKCLMLFHLTLVFIESPLASLWGCVLHQWGVLSSFPILLSVASLFEIPVSTHSLFLWAFQSLESQLRQSKHNGHTVGPYQAAADRDPPCFSIVTTTCSFHMGPLFRQLKLPLLLYCSMVLHWVQSPAGWRRSASTLRGCLHASLK